PRSSRYPGGRATMAALPSTVRRYDTWLCSVFRAAGAVSPHTASTKRPVPTTCPACSARVARTAFRRRPLTGRISLSSMTSTGPSSRTRMMLPVPMRQNVPSFGHVRRRAPVQCDLSISTATSQILIRFRAVPRCSTITGARAVAGARTQARSSPLFLGMRIGISTDVTLTAGAGPLFCEIVHSPRTRGSGTYWRGRPMPAEPPGSGDPLDPAGPAGRTAEAAAIRRMLDGAPLVTVTGLPGVGKTAVSLVAARAADAGFADGSVLLRLDTLRDEALLPHTIAAALRLSDQYTRSR